MVVAAEDPRAPVPGRNAGPSMKRVHEDLELPTRAAILLAGVREFQTT